MSFQPEALSKDQLRAALEEWKRRAGDELGESPMVRFPDDLVQVLNGSVHQAEQEEFHVLLVDTRHRMKSQHMAFRGSLSATNIHPREVFREAVRHAAAGIFLVHNHPSGDPSPSREDLEVTKRLQAAGKVLGIPVLDHVILGRDGGWFSLREEKLMED